MKTVKYGDRIKVECPVCKKVLLQDADEKGENEIEISPCKHTKLWYNSVCGEIVFIHRSLKKEVKNTKGDDDAIFRKISNGRKMIVHRYRGDYIGGCQYPVDTIAFQE